MVAALAVPYLISPCGASVPGFGFFTPTGQVSAQ